MGTKQDSATSENITKSEDNYSINSLPSRPTSETEANVYSIRREGSAEVLGILRVREFPSSPTQYSVVMDPLSGPRREVANIERGEISEQEFGLEHLEQYFPLEEYLPELESEDTLDDDSGIDSYWAGENEKVYVLDGELMLREGVIGDSIRTESLGVPVVDAREFLEKADEGNWTTDEIKNRLNGLPAGSD